MQDDMIAKLTHQASDDVSKSLYRDKIRHKLLEHIPKYYIGGSEGVLQNAIKRYGGHFHCAFRLGYAGFSSNTDGENSFYISYEYFDSYYKHIKPKYYDMENKETLLLTDSDINDIVFKLTDIISVYLAHYG